MLFINYLNKPFESLTVAVISATVSTTKMGKSYVDLSITDSKEVINAKIWESNNAPDTGRVIVISGNMSEYNGKKQAIIREWRYASEENLINFLPRSSTRVEDLTTQLSNLIKDISNMSYRNLVQAIYESFKRELYMAPAAQHHHHTYVYGLLEHSVAVAKLVKQLATTINDSIQLDVDLLVTAALLHDIGKAFTYRWNGLNIELTDKGKLLGHIIIGLEMIQIVNIYNELNTPSLDMLKLQHLIAAHHGKLEWGSPVTPALKEAYILHTADMLDATQNKIQLVSQAASGNWVITKDQQIVVDNNALEDINFGG